MLINTTYALESAEASADGTARFLKNGTSMTPYYTIRDHLGSVRTIVNASGTVVERNDYYPFGSRTTFDASYATLASNRQRFSGKEDQTAVAGSSLPYLDFGARMYDAKLVRWNTYDPMAEKYYGINPYVYCNGDPVNTIDPDGRNPFAYALIKGAIGAAVDAAAQISVSMAGGTTFGQAVSNIDLTSVGASFVTSALMAPGMSTTAKVVSASTTALDAMVDYDRKNGVRSIDGIIGEKKEGAKIGVDVAASVLPRSEHIVNNVSSGFTKAIDAELGSKIAATYTKETKAYMKQVRSIINNPITQSSVTAVAGYTGGVLVNLSKEAVDTLYEKPTHSIPAQIQATAIQANDATRVHKVFPIPNAK